ncbi:hypothetical protein Vafri_7951, partial [Volvox africanus]
AHILELRAPAARTTTVNPLLIAASQSVAVTTLGVAATGGADEGCIAAGTPAASPEAARLPAVPVAFTSGVPAAAPPAGPPAAAVTKRSEPLRTRSTSARATMCGCRWLRTRRMYGSSCRSGVSIRGQ